MGIFDNHSSAFDNASLVDRTPSIMEVGQYKCRMLFYTFGLGQKKGKATYNKPLVKATFEVLLSSHPIENPDGCTRVWVKPFTDANMDFALGEVKSQIAAASGKPVSEITSKHLRALEDSPRQLEGRIFMMETFRNGEYINASFEPWDDRFEAGIRKAAQVNASAAHASNVQASETQGAAETAVNSTPANEPQAEPVW